jgi:fatty-acyl-CoA synthase
MSSSSQDGVVHNGGLLRLFGQHRSKIEAFCHFLQGDEERVVSFSAFFGGAAQFRRRYEDAGLAHGAVVIIATEFSLEGMCAFVGALIGGFVPAFLAPLTERQRVDHFAETISSIIRYTRPAAIVVTPGRVEEFIPADLPTIRAECGPLSGADDGRGWAMARLDDIAFMQFSSGTTGLRKGVMLQHRAALAQIDAFVHAVPLGEGDLIASWLPLYHDMGLIACFMIPLALGIPLALQDPIEWARNPERLYAAIARHRATHVWLPNFAFNHLRLTVPRAARFDLSSMKAFISCSEPCKASTFDGFIDRFADFGVRPEMLATSYAMAEAVFAVTQSPIGRPAARLTVDRDQLQARRKLVARAPGPDSLSLLSTGRLLPGIRLTVLDESRSTLEEGAIGEIALAGEFMFRGYYENAEATEAAIRDGWFLTGDLGAIVDGEVFITGRIKDVIIVNGRNFYAHDIEECVSRVTGVKPGRAAAFPIDNEIAGSEEVAIVAETAWEPVRYREISRMIKHAVGETLGLSAVRPHPVPVGWLVKTTSGKMSRKENREKYVSQRTAILLTRNSK